MWTADCRQGSPGTEPAHQSLVGGASLRQRARLDHLSHSLFARAYSKSISISSITRLDIVTSSNQSKTLRLYTRTVAGFYREFIDALHALGIEAKVWPMPVEVPNPDPIRPGRDALALRSGIRAPLLAASCDPGHDFQGIPRALHREGEPGAFFLGKLRPGGHAVFRQARAGAPGRR